MPADDRTDLDRAVEQTAWAARLGSRAVQRILADNRARGIPSVFELRGQVVYELPDGTLTLDDPFAESRGARGDGA